MRTASILTVAAIFLGGMQALYAQQNQKQGTGATSQQEAQSGPQPEVKACFHDRQHPCQPPQPPGPATHPPCRTNCAASIATKGPGWVAITLNGKEAASLHKAQKKLNQTATDDVIKVTAKGKDLVFVEGSETAVQPTGQIVVVHPVQNLGTTTKIWDTKALRVDNFRLEVTPDAAKLMQTRAMSATAHH